MYIEYFNTLDFDIAELKHFKVGLVYIDIIWS